MTTITISSASINYTAGTTDCALSIAVEVPTVGFTFVGSSCSLSSSDLCPDWTDDQLCAAVADKLGVRFEDVSVAEPPAPAPEPDAPADIPAD